MGVEWKPGLRGVGARRGAGGSKEWGCAGYSVWRCGEGLRFMTWHRAPPGAGVAVRGARRDLWRTLRALSDQSSVTFLTGREARATAGRKPGATPTLRPMPKVTINGKVCEFKPGQTVLQVANANGVEIPQYCYHDGLSIVASCRICLAEAFAPNPKSGQLEPFQMGKLFPTCQTTCVDGMV